MFLMKKCKIGRFTGHLSVLYDKICQVMPMARVMKRMRNASVSVVAMAQYNRVIHIKDTEMILARKGIARYSLKLRM